MKPLMTFCALLALGAAWPQGHAAEQNASNAGPGEPSTTPVPAGAYTLDKAHSSLVFRVNHLGFSNFTARFARFDAQLQFDPANLPNSRVNVTIDPRSIESDNPPAGFMDQLRGSMWFDTERFPQMAFRSTRVELTGANTVRIYGELNFHGVTRPVTLNATFNGGYAGHPMDPHARVGFSAQGSLKRSEFGVGFGIPAPGSHMGVGDEVSMVIESEFSGPPLAGAQGASAGAQSESAGAHK